MDNFETWTKAAAPGGGANGALVFFYAPWCGHCKALKPDYVKVSEAIADLGNEHKMAAIDCDVNKGICSTFGVSSFPTLKYFKDGEQQTFDGDRSQRKLKQWMMRLDDPEWSDELPPFANKPEWGPGDASGRVVFLSDDYFDDYRANQEDDRMLAFFYAPWCGHCKAAKPKFAASSQAFRTGRFVAVDCTIEKDTCEKYGVTGYPTIKWLDGEEVAAYDGARDERGFTDFVTEQTGEEAENVQGMGGAIGADEYSGAAEDGEDFTTKVKAFYQEHQPDKLEDDDFLQRTAKTWGGTAALRAEFWAIVNRKYKKAVKEEL